MDIIHIMTFVTVALLLVVSPGPNGLLIAKTVPTSGKNAGLANVVGFISAFYLHGALSILGISIILTKSAELFFLVKLLGALYLIWIGLKALRSAIGNDDNNFVVQSRQEKRTLLKAYLEGFLTNALNPKVSMFYLAAFPQFIPLGESTTLSAFILVSIHALMNAIWFTGMVLILSRMKAMANNRFVQKAIKAVTGVIFVAFGGKLMTLQVD